MTHAPDVGNPHPTLNSTALPGKQRAVQHGPAREATCRKCKKKGNYQTVCKSKRKVDNVVRDTDDEEDPVNNFLGAVHSSEGKVWKVNMKHYLSLRSILAQK